MSVEVHIERLVVEGFDGLDGGALARSLERELARVLGGHLTSGRIDAVRRGPFGRVPPVRTIELPATAGGNALAKRTAAAVGEVVAGAAGGRSAGGGRAGA